MESRIRAVLELTRIEHSLMLAIAVTAAELIVRGLPTLPVFVLSLITPVFISMASFAINDYYDLEADRLNGKRRPLVRRVLRPKDALNITAMCLVVGIGASFFINYYAFTIAVVFGILALLYSYKLKGIVLLGNTYIALSMAIPFIFGNYVVSNNIGTGIVLVSLMIFLSGLAREIHGTIRDVRGDRKARSFRTLPGVIGIRPSAVLALLFYLIAITISILLFMFIRPFAGNRFYAILIAVSDLLLLYVGIGYLAVPKQKFYDKSRNVSLAGMTIALIAILLAPL